MLSTEKEQDPTPKNIPFPSSDPLTRTLIPRIEHKKRHRPWLTRTFSKMGKGALRGNIFLLLITTTGCVFFYIPYYGKKSGLVMTALMIFMAGGLSQYSSGLLYYGFKATKAKTYDECMTRTMGRFWGFLSNVFVFTHCWGAMISSWIFSYSFLQSVIEELSQTLSPSAQQIYTIVFFSTTLVIIFLSTVFGSVDKLKFVAGLGLFIIVYILIVLFAKLPLYFNFYNRLNLFKLEDFRWELFDFKSWGMCQYLFLNQYTIIPICNNIKDVSSRRLQKVLSRATTMLFFLYISILVIGYFSQPSLELVDSLPELFILRKPLEGTNDIAVIIGKICFIFTLMVAVMVKAQFFLLYFWQIVANLKYFCSSDKGSGRRELGDMDIVISEHHLNSRTLGNDSDLNQKNNNKQSLKIKSTIEKRLMRQSEHQILIGDQVFGLKTKVEGQSESTPQKKNVQFNFKHNQEKTQNGDSESSDGDSDSDSDQDILEHQTSIQQRLTRNLDLEEEEVDASGDRVPEKTWKDHAKNFLILTVVTVLNVVLKDVLSTVLSILGNFVGIFELTIFPFSMILIINRRVKIISNLNVVLIYFLMIFFTLFGLLSFVMTFFVKDKVH